MSSAESTQDIVFGTITVSAKGQVAIPTRIRKRLAIRKGDKLVVALKDDRVLLIPVRDVWRRTVESGFKGLLSLSEGSAKELWDNETDERWNGV